MEFPAAAVERAMTYQQVIMRAVAGTWTWLKAADVLGIHPRSLRRWRARHSAPERASTRRLAATRVVMGSAPCRRLLGAVKGSRDVPTCGMVGQHGADAGLLPVILG